jgi:hypothetical protein
LIRWNVRGSLLSERNAVLNTTPLPCPRPPSVRRSALALAALPVLGVVLSTRTAEAKVVMSADGSSQTYQLLGQAFSIEVPDCGHMVPHITQENDDELHKPVFVFALHVALDDDRCGAKDRQRTEVRNKLPEIAGQNGDTVYYHWKFKLPPGFQTSRYFTHIFQIKSDAADPVMTLSPDNSTMNIDGGIGQRASAPLAKFIGVWAGVDLKILYGSSGHVDMTIKRVDTGEVLLQHSGGADTWQGNGGGHDCKFGLYRSLDDRTALRDEQVRFDDFCFSKGSADDCGGAFPTIDAGSSPLDAANGGTGGDTGGGGTAGSDTGGGNATGGTAGAGTGSGGSETGGADTSGTTGGSGSYNPGTGGFDPGGTGGSAQPGGTTGTGGRGREASEATGAINCTIAMTNPGNGRTTTAFGWLACALGLFRRRRRSDT